ncbi:MAG: phytanoyl-CoA dioxygenase family protein [Planctomycetes bacterium]|nr:phytanoyl-CoA dioxygenase family protein [Planctomycetota bacterium]
MTIGADDLTRFHEQGYLLLDVLPEDDAIALRREIDGILDRHRVYGAVDASFHRSENQHHGDRLAGYGTKAKHYYFHLLTDPSFLSIQQVFHRPEILRPIERILGGSLVINNASLFAAEPGTCYSLPWHRDVIQIPQHEIDEAAIYSQERFHNSVQINLPLADDETLWVVPGSHRRVNSAGEAAAFAGSKHYAPLDAVMPSALNVRMRPGQAVLYNNNIIHRGHNQCFTVPRRSLHLGYHSALRPPTWHFYLLDERMFTAAYRARMSPEVRLMIDQYFACRLRYPRMEDTWRGLSADVAIPPR